MNDGEKPTCARLPDGDSRTLATGSVLDGATEDLFDFSLVDGVAVDVWLVGAGVGAVTSIDPWVLPLT